jgi:hypothetical protein
MPMPTSSAPTDQIGADATGRQLDQVRQRVQLTDHHFSGLTCRRARPGSDAGCRGENAHAANSIR